MNVKLINAEDVNSGMKVQDGGEWRTVRTVWLGLPHHPVYVSWAGWLPGGMHFDKTQRILVGIPE